MEQILTEDVPTDVQKINQLKRFIQSSVLRCIFIKVDVSLPSSGSILRTVTHFLFAKIQMKLVRKNTGDQENTVMT